jgi:hypothetical protein
MFSKEKKLYERDPKSLDIEALTILYGALLAKLLLVTRELGGRYERLASLSAQVPNVADSRTVLSEGAKKLKGLSLVLETVLAQELGKIPSQNS